MDGDTILMIWRYTSKKSDVIHKCLILYFSQRFSLLLTTTFGTSFEDHLWTIPTLMMMIYENMRCPASPLLYYYIDPAMASLSLVEIFDLINHLTTVIKQCTYKKQTSWMHRYWYSSLTILSIKLKLSSHYFSQNC